MGSGLNDSVSLSNKGSIFEHDSTGHNVFLKADKDFPTINSTPREQKKRILVTC